VKLVPAVSLNGPLPLDHHVATGSLQSEYPTQQQIQTQVGELLAVVRLYQALGGGWQTAP
jgi:hypothetical protein